MEMCIISMYIIHVLKKEIERGGGGKKLKGEEWGMSGISQKE